ncbi:MAG: GIY-YIG nuclease family protein [Candidatus Roizmanbacteria bacterium]
MTKTIWHVYVVRCADGTYYSGITTDISRRIKEHNHTSKGARYTRSRRPVSLSYAEVVKNRSAASIREYKIKHMKRSEKEDLVSITVPKIR